MHLSHILSKIIIHYIHAKFGGYHAHRVRTVVLTQPPALPPSLAHSVLQGRAGGDTVLPAPAVRAKRVRVVRARDVARARVAGPLDC